MRISWDDARDVLAERTRDLGVENRRRTVVAIDGPSGAGKSLLAFGLVDVLGDAYVLQTDTYHLPLGAAYRLRPNVGEVGAMIDWRRLEREVLVRGQSDSMLTFTWQNLFDPTEIVEHQVPGGHHLIVDGTFSCRSELRSYYDLAVLINADEEMSHSRRRDRDSGLGDRWAAYVETVWDHDERRHFDSLDPLRFDVIVSA